MLRHCLATLAYRGAKTLRDAPEGFASFQAHDGTRTPLAILAHVNDLLDWMAHLLDGHARLARLGARRVGRRGRTVPRATRRRRCAPRRGPAPGRLGRADLPGSGR